MCTDNHKVDLPSRTRSTFMTAFSPDHSLIASCHGDHNVHVTDLKSEKLVKSLVGHDRSPWCISFHPSSNDILATGCLNGEVRVWDLHGGGSESWIASNENVTIASLSFHPMDQVLLIAGGNEIYLWDWSYPRPFASIKTSNVHEKVRLVRFDRWGSHILTGVVNDEEQNSGGEDEADDNDTVDWGWPPPRPSAGSSQARRRQMLRDWLSGSHPGPSSRASTNRSSTSTAYNLRRRESNLSRLIPRPCEPRSVASQMTPQADVETPVSLFHSATTTTTITQPRRGFSQRPPVPGPNEPAHTYSRDHERILHARVSVNAEIQHQYNRLQFLRQERRRLELRLQQLRDRGNNNTPLPSATEQNLLASHQASPPRPSTTVTSRTGHRALRRLLRRNIPSTQERLLESLNDPGVEMSLNFDTPPSENLTNNVRASIISRTTPTSSFGMMDEPLEEPDVPTFFLPMARSVIIEPPGPRRPGELPNHYMTSSSEQQFNPGVNDQPPPDAAYSRSAQQRSRARQSRTHWRRHQRRLRSINQYLSFYPGHNSPDPTSYRLQWWDFSKLELPEISRSDINVIVPQCKVYNDSSVDISKDGTKLATFIPAELNFVPDSMQVAVFSLEPSTLGQNIFRKSIGPNAVCLSLSPLGGYIAVGVKNRVYSQEGRQLYRFPMAQILRVGHKGCEALSTVVHHVNHPVIPDTPQRFVNINTIAWLPGVGQGLVYGTNNGELRICHTVAS
uniref:Activating molecule in BECN1-regulated autophagy protein 1 n=1 Tax=Phallusia mammillata TaxID=59560 RepID=A0A6F9D5K5_9ASCI|nr:activating molecule in BECN1-regulated autophagy protein 1 [Phallusia mammillata]